MAARRSRWRWPASILAGLLLLLLALNLPFYAGSAPVEGFRWRMEHGRLTLQRSDVVSPQGFWVAANAEGLRWSPPARWHDAGSWELVLPLWMPLLAA